MKKILLTAVALHFLSTGVNGQTTSDLKAINSSLSVFQDQLATTLKKGIRAQEINKLPDPFIKNIALEILEGKYKKDYKYNIYKALLSPTKLGKDLSIGDGYSKYENLTGVYLPLGKHIVLVEGIERDKKVNLVVPNWERKAPTPEDPTKDPKGWGIEKQIFQLQNGLNIIDLKEYGSLAYIDYFSENPSKETPIKVHFITGKVNGFFDVKKHDNEAWNKLVDNAVFPILDGIGAYIQIAYPVEALKKYAYGKGVELISNYDSLVYRQHRIMGLIKYNKVPDNKILSRVNYNYYMFRDGDGVAYMGDKKGYAMNLVVDPNRVIKGDPCWGFSHEVGHVHQTRPMFNWGGLGEVSNNLFSLYVTRSFDNPTRVSEQGNYKSAREKIIEERISFLQDPDVFNRLIPFWQLQLYFEGVGKNPDFYPDLFEAFRLQASNKTNQVKNTNWAQERKQGERNPAVHQLNFVKTACEVAKTDLTDFFDKYGFFTVGEFEMDDYGKYTYKMTAEMADRCRNEIQAMGLKKPVIDLTTLVD